MSNQIPFVPVDSALEVWLLEKLLRDPPKSRYAPQLPEGVRSLAGGECSALLLGDRSQSDALARLLSDSITAGDLTIYPKSRKVLRRGGEISLTPKEFDILYFLVQNRGQVFTKEQIYRAVWSEDYLLDDSNIMAFVRKLRKKIEPHPDAPQYILTIWGIGYKFHDGI